jgi:hypothetical protein
MPVFLYPFARAYGLSVPARKNKALECRTRRFDLQSIAKLASNEKPVKGNLRDARSNSGKLRKKRRKIKKWLTVVEILSLTVNKLARR